MEILSNQDHATPISRGVNAMNKGVESIFESSGKSALDYEVNERQNEKLKEFIEDGGIDQQLRESPQIQPSYAEGGL